MSGVSDSGLEAVVNAILGSNVDMPVSKALTTFSSITDYITGNEKWYDSMVKWIAEHLVDDSTKKKMFQNEDGTTDLTAARAFLESIRNQKQAAKQVKWRVPSVYQRIAEAEQNKTINPLLIRGLTNSSSSQFNKLYA
jgi:hypothetical protein